MKYLLIILILIIVGTFGCIEQERDDAFQLSVCNEFPECSVVVVDSGLSALRCNLNASPFAMPCFKDSTKDTIYFRLSNRQKSFIKVELLENSGKVMKVFVNDTMPPGNSTFSWSNKRDGEIYGCRMFLQGDEMTYWFFAD